MRSIEGNNNRFESYVPPRDNLYDYRWYWDEQVPDVVLLSKQIQAQSYVTMRLVRPEGLVTLPDGTQIVAENVSNPSGVETNDVVPGHTQYAIGVRKDTDDLSPLTGKLVAWRKVYRELERLPAYEFCQDVLWPAGEQFLREVVADPNRIIAEPEALGKTRAAEAGVIKEFIRNEIQRVYGTGEIWFMGLVEKTAYRSWVHNWGSVAVCQIGEPKRLTNPLKYDDVLLVPTVIDVDNFYVNMAHDIMMRGPDQDDKLIANFVYMAHGINDEKLGADIAAFRAWAVARMNAGDGDSHD